MRKFSATNQYRLFVPSSTTEIRISLRPALKLFFYANMEYNYEYHQFWKQFGQRSIENILKFKTGDVLHPREGGITVAHCISEDLKLGAGVALKVRKKYPSIIKHLRETKKTVGEVCMVKYKEDYIFNLITKKRFFEKPTYFNIFICLQNLRKLLLNLELNTIRIPLIGCGLDKKKWLVVKYMISFIFKDSKLKVITYNYHKV